MQTGLGFDDSEVKNAIKQAALAVSSTDIEDMDVKINYWRGDVSAIVIHKDGSTPIELL